MGVLAGETVGFNFSKKNKYKKSAGVTENNILFFYKKGEGTQFFFKVNEIKDSASFGLKRFGDIKKLENYLVKSKEVLEKSEKTYKEFLNIDLKSKTPIQLLKLFKKELDVYQRVYSYYHACQPQYFSGIEQETKRRLGKDVSSAIAEELYLTLTLSDELDPLRVEELEWLNIVKKIKEFFRDKTKISKQDLLKKKRLYDLINNHSKKYVFLGTVEVSTPWNFEYYLKLLNQQLKENTPEKIKKIQNRRLEVLRKKNELIKKYKIDQQIVLLCRALARIGVNRLKLRFGWTKLSFAYLEVIGEIAKRKLHNALSLENVFELNIQELEDALINKKYISKEEIRNRKEAFLFYVQNGNLNFYSGEKAFTEKEKLVPKEYFNLDEVRGIVACRGKVRGRVILFTWLEEDLARKMEKMKKGDILVAGQTRPFLMPAIRKAGGIVVDDGGITSHASIISRELKIPCVIGTKVATKVFKDGDLVEVDANKGVVKKILR
jgi:pyruvate,water dikinase